jgi:hypothetical protein
VPSHKSFYAFSKKAPLKEVDTQIIMGKDSTHPDITKTGYNFRSNQSIKEVLKLVHLALLRLIQGILIWKI